MINQSKITCLGIITCVFGILFSGCQMKETADIDSKKVQINLKINAKSLGKIQSLGIRGNLKPLSWEKSLFAQDTDGDGIFEVSFTIPVKEGSEILEYKCVIENDPIIWELAKTNRFLQLTPDSLSRISIEWNKKEPLKPQEFPKLSPEKLQADFKILKTALESLHPGIYRYTSKSQMDLIFSEAELQLKQPLTYSEFYTLISKITGEIKCGHTFASFYNQPAIINELIFAQPDKLPLTFRIIEGKIIVDQNLSDQLALSNYPEILAINGIDTKIILSELQKFVKADGINNPKRLADLNLHGFGEFESFDSYFPLIYPPKNGKYELQLLKAGETKPSLCTITPISRSDRSERIRSKYPELFSSINQLWSSKIHENNTAYLQLLTFDSFQLPFEWKPFLDSVFQDYKLKGVNKLVIDIRGNEGGQDEILFELGKKIAKSSYKIPQSNTYVAYQVVPEALKPYLNTWQTDVYDLSSRIEKQENGLYRLKSEKSIILEPALDAFQGEVTLLVNATNSSATFLLAEIAKELKLANIIGEPTGGSQKGLNSGVIFFLRLPNSKIEVDIPIFSTVNPEKPDAGIQPDILVSETEEAFRAKRDLILERALQRNTELK